MTAGWIERALPGAAAHLASTGFPRRIAELLALRGIEDSSGAQEFLTPSIDRMHDPREMTGIDSAVALLLDARANHTRVAVVGDYDVDGISASAILLGALRALGVESDAILPSRRSGGYGLQPAHVERAAASGARLVVTADCGTHSHEAIDTARRLAIPVIVTDHHLPGDLLPAAAAFVNPRQSGCRYPFRDLSGSGLALKLAVALFQAVDREPPWDALLRMASLGTIADSVPLRGENRTLAKIGLSTLRATPSPGLQALMRSAQIGERLTASDVAYRIGPRLNAPGRIGDPDPALELLLTRDPRRAQLLAAELENANRTRQALERRVLEECERELDRGFEDPIFVAWSAEWHRGVVGIAAGRLARQLGRPVLLFACDGDGFATGSGRSVEQVDLHALLAPTSERLIRFGGHAQAVGMTAEIARLPELRQAWLELAALLPAETRQRRVEYDLRLGASEVGPALHAELQRLEPFGASNPEPVFRFGPLRLAGTPRRFGTSHLGFPALDGNKDRFDVVAWKWADRPGPWSEAFEILGAIEADPRGGAAPVRVRLIDARRWNESAP